MPPSAAARWTDRRPLGFAFLLLIAWALVTLLGNSLLLDAEVPPLELITTGPIWGIAAAGIGLLILLPLLRWRGAALGAPLWGQLRIFWFPALYLLMFLLPSLALDLPPRNVIWMLALNTFFVGLSEELMFRGVLFPALRSRMGIWPAIWIASIVFGVAHVSNVLITGALLAGLAQAVAATLSALVFMALLLRTGSLWPCILFHAAWDFSLFLLQQSAATQLGEQPDPSQIDPVLFLGPILFILPNALYALWLIRKAGKEVLPGDPGRGVPLAA